MKTTIRTLVMACPMLLIVPLSGAAAAPVVSPVDVEYRQLERDIPSLYLINGLFLSADQSKSLAALQAEGKIATDKIQLDMDQFLQEHGKDLDQWLEAVLRVGGGKGKGRGNASADWVRLRKVRQQWMSLVSARESALNDVAVKTLAILTPAQADIVNRFVPCFIPPRDFRSPERVGQADGDTSVGEKILSRLREAPRERQAQGREKALDLLVPYVMKNRHQNMTAEDMQQLRTQLGKDLDKMTLRIQKMSDADFALEKSKLVQEILCLEEKHTPAPDSRETQHKVKRYLLNPGIQDILSRRAGLPAAKVTPNVTRQMLDAALQERVKPYRAAGLVNDLSLTPTQAATLLPIVRGVVERRSAIDGQARQIMREALPAYQALKQELANQQPSSAAETAASRYHQKVKVLYEENLMREMLVAEGQVDLFLSADQVATLMGQKKGRSVKAGAKKRHNDLTPEIRRRAATVFDVMDKTPDVDWPKIKRETCRCFVESCVKDRLLSREDVDVAAQTARAEQILDNARQRVQSDYLRARDDLIAELCPRRNQPRPTVYSWKKAKGDPLESLNPTTYLLFSPAMEPVLKKVAARRKS